MRNAFRCQLLLCLIATSFLTFGFNGSVMAGQCSGNGCQYTSLEMQGNCLAVRNSGPAAIQFAGVGAGTPAGVVYAHSTALLTLQGQCYSNFPWNYTSYIVGNVNPGNGCIRVQNMHTLGFGGGNKTSFCQSKGYDGPTNFPGTKYYDNGGGWCYSGNEAACLAAVRGQH
jgi:hypothetical protein